MCAGPSTADCACRMSHADLRRQEGGLREAQRLHERMGELIWVCRGWHGLSAAAQHYSRGDDLLAYAAGLIRPQFDVRFSIATR